MAKLIAEIELYVLLPYHRRNSNWFPQYIYYLAHTQNVRDWNDNLPRQMGADLEDNEDSESASNNWMKPLPWAMNAKTGLSDRQETSLAPKAGVPHDVDIEQFKRELLSMKERLDSMVDRLEAKP
ncbi:hypothetical protein BC938DRAFT_479462 [Jimgerdemannia flammicorona]|uniref:Uncharacterized protein n=1 Tax=Jimgerdemannia flammicorona TaxID=994334 RepID=A0A433QKV2_9FUNG|nr:hypothetical protein BC938DRAFT_479462 [Jimgerdemannia flammicorona]